MQDENIEKYNIMIVSSKSFEKMSNNCSSFANFKILNIARCVSPSTPIFLQKQLIAEKPR